MNIDYENLRITKLREYLFTVVSEINENVQQINADMLSNDIDNYSLDKIPTSTTVVRWINGKKRCRDLYSFRSRNKYSQEVINNLENIGFYEMFEKIIEDNNREKKLPEISGIESIECLNCGTLKSSTTNTAEFDIQIQIVYIV